MMDSYILQAYISTLTSKLSRDTGKWSLSCKINDGTMACDVDLSDTVRLYGPRHKKMCLRDFLPSKAQISLFSHRD